MCNFENVNKFIYFLIANYNFSYDNFKKNCFYDCVHQFFLFCFVLLCVGFASDFCCFLYLDFFLHYAFSSFRYWSTLIDHLVVCTSDTTSQISISSDLRSLGDASDIAMLQEESISFGKYFAIFFYSFLFLA